VIHPVSSCSQGWGQVLGGRCRCWCRVAPIPFVDIGSTRDPPCKQLLTRLGRALGEFVVVFFILVFYDPSPFAVSLLGCPITLVPSFPSRTHASNPPCEQRLAAVGGRGMLLRGP
jgi:hypothetical protein